MPRRRQAKRLERADWIFAAREALIVGGIDQVKVDRLATSMNITRGSFYWFFKNRDELLDAVLQDWEETNTGRLLAALGAAGNPREQLQALFTTWLEEKSFSPRYDSAVRDWARTSRKVARAVRAADERRIHAITGIFSGFGYEPEEAFVRGRITYFHQVGYYALHLRESHQERNKLAPLYYAVLTGKGT